MLDKMDLNPKYHLQLVEKGPDEPDEEFEEVFIRFLVKKFKCITVIL